MEIVVSVATGVIKPLVYKLSKLLEEEGARLKGVRRNTGFIRDELTTMGATLQILADTEDLDPEMRIWRDGIRELSYDMEDCIDDFMARVDHDDGPTGIKGFFDKIKKLKPRHEIAREIEKLKARAMEASERHKRYKIDRAPPGGSSIDPRLQALYVEVDKLVGIESPKEDIIKWYEDKASSTELRVVSIVGPGGLGKTTLANQVYHAIKSQFSCAAFLSVSRKPDMKNVLRNIAERVGVTRYTSNDDEHLLTERLREHLRDKKYFIVVDDVWDNETWKTIKDALLNNNCGSRIITTTRNSAVALCCSSEGDYVYRMKPLSFNDSRRLLLTRAFGCEDACHPHLEEVSNKILEKCDGLPLAIITISSLLSDQHAVDEWTRVLAAIGSGLAKDPNAGNMTKILSLSYFDLPHHMRACLLYLSLFPEDCTINKQRLISRWIAEGFVPEEKGRRTYEVGERYFNDLINRSLIQPTNVVYGEVEECHVHDIVLDFITWKATEENFITSFDRTNHAPNSNYRVRRLSFKHSNKITIPTRLILSHVRSLTVFGNFIEDSLLNFPSLRVLDLGECEDLEDNLLTGIQKMFLLKYLCVGSNKTTSNKITRLPRQLEELQYIETLDIRDADITELPSTISRLRRLARLYVSFTMRFPDGLIGQLQSLEELSEFGVNSYEDGMSLQQFSQLTELKRLTVSFCLHYWDLKERQIEDVNGCVDTLISSCSIQHLYLFGTLERVDRDLPASITPSSLRKLVVEIYTFIHVPSWMSSRLVNLTELVLSIFCMRPEDVAILGTMPTLLRLEVDILYGSNGRIVLCGFKCLKYLKLEIKKCGTAVKFVAGSMKKVEHLNLEFPVHMTCVSDPCDLGIWRLPALTKVDIAVSGHRILPGDEVISIVKQLVGALPINPTISFPLTGWCDHFDYYLIRSRRSLPKGIEIRDNEATRLEIKRLQTVQKELAAEGEFLLELRKDESYHARVYKERHMRAHATTFTFPELQLSLGAQAQDIHNGEQHEMNKEGLAETHGSFTVTATSHEIEAMPSGNTDANEPVVAHPSVPFTFAAVSRATAMLGHKNHVRATSKRGHRQRGKAALQRPPRLAAIQDPLYLYLADAMRSSASPSVP